MAGHLALVLPGGAAGPFTAPLLIPSLALEQSGASVEVVPYPDFRPQGLERDDAVAFDAFVVQEIRKILRSRRWDKLTFIAKSRGTMVLAGMPDIDLPSEVSAIWVTPLLGLPYVLQGVINHNWRSLLVAGGADPYHDPDAHDEVLHCVDATSLIIANADHGLVVRRDVRSTVEGLEQLAEASLHFAAIS